MRADPPEVDSPSPPPRTGYTPSASTRNPSSSSTTGNYSSRQVNVNAGTTNRHAAVPADDRRTRPREAENEHAATTYMDHPPRYAADDRRSRPQEPENEHAATGYLVHAPRHATVPDDDGRARPRKPQEDEHDATLPIYQPRAPVSGPSHGVIQPHEQPPFIPPTQTFEDGPEKQRERQRSRKSPESSSDDHSGDDFYEFSDSDMDVDSSDLDSTPAMSGKGKGVEVTPASRPTNTQASYSYVTAHPPYSGLSSASTAAYRHQGPSNDSHRTQESSWSTPSYGKQNYPSLPSQKPSLCVVCKKKPPYDRNGKSYPTCGLTCAAQLEEQKKRDAWWSGRSYPEPCEVCHVRPRYRNSSGRTFPTCGNRCAAIRDPGRTCTVCKKRPKLSNGTGKYYDQCSTCRDKAKTAPTNATIVTCGSCLACWVKPAQSPDQPYCSDDCRKAMSRCAPALIEMPRGHIMFDKYHKQFLAGWDTTSQRKVVARHMYFFAQAPVIESRYETYKALLEDSLRGRRSTDTEGWVAITRECNVGDSGSVATCHSPTCDFCNIMVNSFTRHKYPQGVPAAFTAAKASEELRNIRHGPTKALLFVTVVHTPRLTERTQSQLFGSQRPPEDVVAVIPYSSSRTRTGLRVYNLDAILPLGLLVYSEK